MIVSINDTPVRDAREVARRIGSQAPGSSIKLGVIQKGSLKTLNLTLGELPKQRETRADVRERGNQGAELPRLGLSLAPAADVAGSGSEGVVITSVDPNGMGAEVGLKTGDVILNVGGKAVASMADIRKAFDDARAGGKRTVLMRVKSGESARFVALPVGRA